MLDYKININLKALKGAEAITVTYPDGKKMRGIFIPAAYNGMLYTNKDTGRQEVSFFVSAFANETSSTTKDASRKRNSHIEGYEPPSHLMRLNYPKDFREQATEAARKRIKAEQPDIDEDTLNANVRKSVSPILGDMTPLAQRERMYEPKTQVTVEPQADGGSMNDEPGEATPVDDLPF